MKNPVYILLGILVLVSCNREQNVEYQEVVYEPQELERKPAVDLPLSDISSDYQLNNPNQIDFVTDSLLVIYDQSGNERLCHLLTYDGRYKGGFGMIGKGQGELLFPEKFNVGDDNQSIYVYDWGPNASVKFMVDDILSGRNNPLTISISDSLERRNIGRLKYACHFTDDDYIGFGYNEQCRIIYYSDSHVSDIYTKYPSVSEKTDCDWSIWGNIGLAKCAVSPNRKYLVNATYVGALFEIFELHDGTMRSKKVKGFYKPEYYEIGTEPVSVGLDANGFGGFTSIYATDTGFFGVVHGEDPDFTGRNMIYEFDYDGDLKNKYRISGEVSCLSVNPAGEMYLVVGDENGEQHLKKADLKAV